MLNLLWSLYLKLNTEIVPMPPHICPLSPGHLVEQSLFEIAVDSRRKESKQKHLLPYSKYNKMK